MMKRRARVFRTSSILFVSSAAIVNPCLPSPGATPRCSTARRLGTPLTSLTHRSAIRQKAQPSPSVLPVFASLNNSLHSSPEEGEGKQSKGSDSAIEPSNGESKHSTSSEDSSAPTDLSSDNGGGNDDYDATKSSNGESKHSADSEDSSAPTDLSSNNGSGNDNYDDGGHKHGDDDGDEDDQQHDTLAGTTSRDKNKVSKDYSELWTELSTEVLTFVSSSQLAITQGTQSLFGRIAYWAKELVKTVPPPVLVALISLVSTILGSRYRLLMDKQSKEAARIEAARKRKHDIERELRQKYDEFATPILKSASTLAQRLEMMINVNWSCVEDDKNPKHSPMYSAYLLGRLLAHVEILKSERALLDYGFPTADRILANILGRVQGVLAANDQTLMKIQHTEQFFKPYPGNDVIPAGLLKISPKNQTIIGQLLLRNTWKSVPKDCKYEFVAQYSNDVSCGSKAVISFLEFTQLFKKNKEVMCRYKDIVSDFENLEKTINSRRNKRRYITARPMFNREIGARVFFLQSALLDLVEFFDPLPHAQSIPMFERIRLQIGPHGYRDCQRAPQSLHKLYNELANFREHRQFDDASQRLALDNNSVEVFVTGVYSASRFKKTSNPKKRADDDGFHDDEFVEPSIGHANCPYTHRVTIALKEMGIPFQSVPICPDNKPPWYYVLNPMTQTPVIYYKGDVVQDSSNIVSYISSKIVSNTSTNRSKFRPLNSAANLQLSRGTSALTKFNDHFMEWASTKNPKFKKHTELELRRLNRVIQYAQVKNGGLPFLGGARFSREDTAIIPLLHYVDISGKKGLNWHIPKDCTALVKYLNEARMQPSFEYAGSGEDAVMQRFQAHIQLRERRAKKERLADILE